MRRPAAHSQAYLAGHSDLAATPRYVHPRTETVLAAMEKAREAQRLAQIERNGPESVPSPLLEKSAVN